TAQNFISSDDQPFGGVTVSWSVVASAVPGDVSIFDVDNTFTVISGSTAGSFTVRATAGGISHDCVVTIVDCPNTMKDIEANEYTVGWFGSAGCWMTQNLRSTKRSENETLTENVNSDNSNTACYYYPNTDNTILNSHPEYGLLYTWAAANIGASVDESSDAFSGTVSTRQGICPSGWHLPSDYEWNQLEKEIATNPGNYSSQTIAYANASGYDFGSSTSWRPSSGMNNTYWGRQMKSTTAVNSQATTYGTSKSRSEGGFDVLLVGGMGNGSAFLYGTSTYFWSSSSSNSSDAWYRDLAYGASGVARNTNYKFRLFSVRCKKDDH
ncbi:MAG: fibrobacter succinogenes major paralogous domain-containing protein, partial [Dysgonamonadaceae bacterium]|nr:fibrobacter succinogenes major paralogous domain-containing protein [Dysgonamonadaceae bacterium]